MRMIINCINNKGVYMNFKLSFLAIIATCTLSATASYAEDYIITSSEHKFTPQELRIPADTKVKVVIKNLNDAPMEFESYELNREKIIEPKGQATIFIGPLSAGTYQYFDEFKPESKGSIIVGDK